MIARSAGTARRAPLTSTVGDAAPRRTAARGVFATASTLLALAGGLAAATPSALAQRTSVAFTDFTAISGDVATGRLLGASVSVSGSSITDVTGGSVVDGTATYFDAEAFTPRLTKSDLVEIIGIKGSSYRITFEAPATDPVLHLGSLASRIEFPAGTEVDRVSGDGSAFVVAGSSVTGAVNGSTDANGTVRIAGTFTSLRFTAEPVFDGRDGIFVQLGAAPPAPPPAAPQTTSTPPAAGPPAGPPPSARFTTPATATALEPVVLDASGTTGATEHRWDFDGNGRTDLITDANAPVVRVTLPRAESVQVKLTAVGPDGKTSVTSRSIIVGAVRRLPKLIAAGLPAVVAAGPAASRAPTAELARKPCLNTTVAFRLIEARGCFVRTQDPNDAPAERDVGRRHYEDAGFSQPVVVRSLCEQAAKGTLPQARCDQARAFFAKPQDFYISRQPIKLSGITVTPRNGAAVVVFPSLERVISSDALMVWGGMTVKSGVLDLDLKNQAGIRRVGGSDFPVGSAPLLSFDGRRDLPQIAGFRLDGSIALSVEAIDGRRSSVGALQLTLPPVFSLFGGRPPNASTTLRADNDREPVVDNLSVNVPEANLGAVRFTDLNFTYALAGGIDGDRSPGTSCSRKEWKARGNVFLAGGEQGETGFRLTPPPSQNGVGFCDGSFKHAGGAVTFGGPIPKPVLFPGVLLDEINFALQLNPFLVRGGGQISVAGISSVKGALLMAFPTVANPYVLTTADAGREFAPLAGRRFTSPTVAVGGDVGVNAPGFGRIGFGNGALVYSFPDYVFFSGQVRVVVPGLAIFGGLSGEASVASGRFQTGGSVRACLGGFDNPLLCPGASANLGSRGVSACLTIGPLHPGAGYRWGERFPEVWPLDGCKPSRFWITNVRTRAAGTRGRAAQASRTTFTVAEGEPVKHVRLTGSTAAPAVTVRGPSGEALDVTREGFAFSPSRKLGGIRIDAGRTTFISVKAGPGRYTIEPAAGSAPIVALAASRKGYDSDYRASVSGTGPRRTLRYDVGPEGGQSVELFEKGATVMRRLGTATGGTGQVRFTPAPGPAETRTIVAIATLDGVPIPDQVLARFRAPGVVRTGRPGSVRVRRRGPALVVGWRAAVGATGYGVVVQQADGRQQRFRASAHRRSLRIPRVSLDYGGTVRVSALGRLRDWGKPATAAYSAIQRPFTVLQTDTDNERTAAEAMRRRQARRGPPHNG